MVRITVFKWRRQVFLVDSPSDADCDFEGELLPLHLNLAGQPHLGRHMVVFSAHDDPVRHQETLY